MDPTPTKQRIIFPTLDIAKLATGLRYAQRDKDPAIAFLRMGQLLLEGAMLYRPLREATIAAMAELDYGHSVLLDVHLCLLDEWSTDADFVTSKSFASAFVDLCVNPTVAKYLSIVHPKVTNWPLAVDTFPLIHDNSFLSRVAIEEVLPWLHAPAHAQVLNSPSMEAHIWEAIAGEAGHPSGSGFVEANTEVNNLLVLLRPGLPTSLAELWSALPQVEHHTVVGLRRRLWRENARPLHARERGVLPEGRWPSEKDEDLYLVQANESTELNIPPSCTRPGLLPRRGVQHARRRHHVPRPAPLFREARQPASSSCMVNAFYPPVSMEAEDDLVMEHMESEEGVNEIGESAGDDGEGLLSSPVGAGVGLSEGELDDSSTSSASVELEDESDADRRRT
ncbi:unnamed protein product, partial [Symbiodinium sp. CCMP2456]